MQPRVRIFIDFWNFQLSWNRHMGRAQCDYKMLPRAVLASTSKVISEATGDTQAARLEETLLYASVNPRRDEDSKLRGWLQNTVDRFPSYRVHVTERRPQLRSIRCNSCSRELSECPSCSERYIGMVEKGVDTAIVTDLLSLAWQDAYDVAVIISSDGDFVPAAERLQERGLKVVNATWPGTGHHLAKACWGSFDLLEIAPELRR